MKHHRMRQGCWIAWIVVLAVLETAAWAQTPSCDALGKDLQAVRQTAFASLHPYDGCDDTFEQCLAQPIPHPLVKRLANDLCRQIAAGARGSELERALAKRAKSMLAQGKQATFQRDDATLVGDPAAPIEIVAAACARCPFCKVVIPTLYREITSGSLKGKARMYFRPFPLKDHPGSLEGGLGLVAAARLGKLWPFLLKVYERYEAFCPATLPDWAEEVGMNRVEFERVVAAPETRQYLVIAKQEGIRNKVDATPTLFIDGRKYFYDMQREVLIDVIEEAFEARRAF